MKHERIDRKREIANRYIEMLKQGVRPWMKPWNAQSTRGTPMMPLRHSGEFYSGVNILLLGEAAAEGNFISPYWMTFRQAKKMGGHVTPGSKATIIFYSDSYVPKEEKERIRSGEIDEKEAIRLKYLKAYPVFNADQIANLPAHFNEVVEHQPLSARVERAECFFAAIGATVHHGGNVASNDVSSNLIRMPPFTTFTSPESYYSARAHETIHWTRHPDRLNRDFGQKSFGDEGYAFEELVAEIGAAILCMQLGITADIPEENASYVSGWLKHLKSDPQYIFTAVTHAQKAVDYLTSLAAETAVAA